MVKIGRGAPPRIATGQYTGDGTLSQAIIGIGFRPRYIKIWMHVVATANIQTFLKTDTFAGDLAEIQLREADGADHRIISNRIVSLDADGFTVDDNGVDAHPNKLGQVYDYICLG